MLITVDGTIIRIPVASISIQGRATQGVRLMKVGNSRISRVAPVAKEEELEEDAEEETPAGDSPDALDMLLDDLENNPEPPVKDEEI